MKTKINQIATIVFIALFILVGNVNAKGTEKSTPKNESIENKLELEGWMINDNLWNCVGVISFENEVEEALQLENWMTNDKVWESEIIIEEEQILEVEPWMTNENIWN